MEKGLSIRSARTTFDLINLALSASVSLIFVGRIIGIGIGTLVSALLMGTVMGKVTGWIPIPCAAAFQSAGAVGVGRPAHAVWQ